MEDAPRREIILPIINPIIVNLLNTSKVYVIRIKN